MKKVIRNLLALTLTLLSVLPSIVLAMDDSFPGKLITAQLTEESMEMGMKSAILDDCIKNGHSETICQVEVAMVDQIDLRAILEKVYVEVYTLEEMRGLYGFYSTDLGGKYSQALLSILSEDMSYQDVYLMPEFTEEEEIAIAEHLMSDLTKIEQNAQPQIQVSVTKHVTRAFQALQSVN